MEKSITMEPLIHNGQTIIVLKPIDNQSADLGRLLLSLKENRLNIEGLLTTHGGVLLRGFEINNKEEFLRVKSVFSGDSGFNYVDGNSPRTKLGADVYTSTEYPREFKITLHNELSYSSKWPGNILFCCNIPAEEGGETPVIDCRYLLNKLDKYVVDKFEKLGVKYTRYLNGTKGVGKTWMETFETTDKKIVEEYCDRNAVEYQWEENNIRLSQIGAGVATHPKTGEKVWFNQANQFHPSSLPEDIYRMLKIMYGNKTNKYPQYALYGNGEEIQEDHLKAVTDAQFEYSVRFTWQKGDVLILDNMLMAHGRMPFKGERKILVSMY